MFKPVLIFVICLLLFKATNAQKSPNAFYLTNAGLLTSKDSADYILMILPPDKSISKTLYSIRVKFPDGI
jgi:hypothetical protein